MGCDTEMRESRATNIQRMSCPSSLDNYCVPRRAANVERKSKEPSGADEPCAGRNLAKPSRARCCPLPPSCASQIEAGRPSPSLDALVYFASRLGLRFEDLYPSQKCTCGVLILEKEKRCFACDSKTPRNSGELTG